jgi:hypothetical protein
VCVCHIPIGIGGGAAFAGVVILQLCIISAPLRSNCAKPLSDPCIHPFAEITESFGSSIRSGDSFLFIEIP